MITTTIIEKDIKVFYIKATSFPQGIEEAMQKLQSLFSFTKERQIFGLSRPENNEGIIYLAAAEELYDGEAENMQCNTLIIPKGRYIAIEIIDFRKDLMNIGRAFQQLLKAPNLDPQGYCVEWYANDKEAVTCMIRLDE
jgi:predicted transcriptional regulator YdeE